MPSAPVTRRLARRLPATACARPSSGCCDCCVRACARVATMRHADCHAAAARRRAGGDVPAESWSHGCRCRRRRSTWLVGWVAGAMAQPVSVDDALRHAPALTAGDSRVRGADLAVRRRPAPARAAGPGRPGAWPRCWPRSACWRRSRWPRAAAAWLLRPGPGRRAAAGGDPGADRPGAGLGGADPLRQRPRRGARVAHRRGRPERRHRAAGDDAGAGPARHARSRRPRRALARARPRCGRSPAALVIGWYFGRWLGRGVQALLQRGHGAGLGRADVPGHRSRWPTRCRG